LNSLVGPAEVAGGCSVNKLGVLTSDSASLKPNGYFRRRAHRPGPPLVPLPDLYPDDGGDYTIGFDGPGFPSRPYAEQVRLRQTHHAPWVLWQ
jgi:hypothetical protein